jgi:hypothetical protein
VIRWIAVPTAAVVLVVSLTGCRDHGLDSSSVNQSTPAVATSADSGSVDGAGGAVAGATPPATTPAANPSSALAQVSADLSGITVAASQASGDLSAGDSARTQPDDGN